MLIDDIDIVITTCYGCSNPLLMNHNISISHLIIDEPTQIVEKCINCYERVGVNTNIIV